MAKPSETMPVTRALEARTRAGLSRVELAAKSGLAVSTIWIVEARGDARPSTLSRLAAALGVEPPALRGLVSRRRAR